LQFADEQAASRVTLENGTVLTACDQCRTMYAERKPHGTPPCESCRVELREENEEAARIYQLVRRQIITFFNGEVDKEIDLNFASVNTVMDIYNVKNKLECFNKVIRAYYHFLGERQKE
jgi:hypothetical protein